jgi:hypothetical protein
LYSQTKARARRVVEVCGHSAKTRRRRRERHAAGQVDVGVRRCEREALGVAQPDTPRHADEQVGLCDLQRPNAMIGSFA